MKNGLVVRVVAKGYVVVVALNIYLAASGAAIAKPSTVEPPTIPPRHERPEILNGGLQRGEAGAEKCVDVLGPSSGVRIDGAKLGKDSRAERSASVGTAPTIIGAVAKPSNEAGGENAACYLPKVGEKKIDDFIHGWLIGGTLMAYMLWVTGAARPMKHNVKLRRLRGFSRRSPRTQC